MSIRQTPKLFVMRHGERIDYAFPEWMTQCFDESGNYTPINLNMPETLPPGSRPYTAFAKDTPLTKLGIFQAQLTGEAFKNAQLDLTHVYCSPSFRCIQTSDAFLKGCNKRNEIKIRIEPGLFEWLAFYQGHLPDWLTPEEIAACGYNIDLNYKPSMPVDKSVKSTETNDEYYNRSFLFTQEVLNTHTDNVLFVGHATTLEVCSRQLIGRKPRQIWGEKSMVKAIPYCAFVEISQNNDKWELHGPHFPQLTHTFNLECNAGTTRGRQDDDASAITPSGAKGDHPSVFLCRPPTRPPVLQNPRVVNN